MPCFRSHLKLHGAPNEQLQDRMARHAYARVCVDTVTYSARSVKPSREQLVRSCKRIKNKETVANAMANATHRTEIRGQDPSPTMVVEGHRKAASKPFFCRQSSGF
jgi:hypothetical protein